MSRFKNFFAKRPPPSADTFNDFTTPQWGALLLLDVGPKAALFWFQPAALFILVVHPSLVVFPVLLIIVIVCVVSFFRLKAIWAFLVILLTTSILCISAVTYENAQRYSAQWRHACFYTPGLKGCEQWVNGAPLSHVIKVVTDELPFVAINSAPFIVVFIYSRWRVRRKLSQRAA